MTVQLTRFELLARSLANEGVEIVFGCAGSDMLPFSEAFAKFPSMGQVLVRHELAATHMADGFARASGKPGVVLVTSTAGASNSIPGIATAYMDSIPLVVVSSREATALPSRDAFDETDMIGVSRPVVKHSYIVRSPLDIPRIIKEAHYIARTGRPGPVVVDIPNSISSIDDTFPYECPDKVYLRSYNPPTKGHRGQIRRAVNALLSSKRPIIFAGGGVVQGEASEELTQFASKLKVPVTTTFMGLGAFPGDHEQCLGVLGMNGTHEANRAMHHSELVLALGCRFDDKVMDDPNQFCPNARVIHVDIDSSSIAKVIEADLPIVGPCKAILKQMVEMLDEETIDPGLLVDWWKEIEQWRAKNGSDTPNTESIDSGSLRLYQVMNVIRDHCGTEAYVATDCGHHQVRAAQSLPFLHPRRWISPGGVSVSGFGLPAAMGAQISHPDATVVYITGEGGFLANVQELLTCQRYDLPLKIFNMNSGNLSPSDPDPPSTNLGGVNLDVEKLVESFGHTPLIVDNLELLQDVTERVFYGDLKDQLVFVDVKVASDEHV